MRICLRYRVGPAIQQFIYCRLCSEYSAAAVHEHHFIGLYRARIVATSISTHLKSVIHVLVIRLVVSDDYHSFAMFAN